MKIGGLLKTTLADFPGTVACTVFLEGCPFRCHFCHNPELVIPEKFNPEIPEEDFFDFLHSRLGKIKGVCITGGEPLLQKDILEFIQHIKAIGYKVKLDTNGFFYEKLKEIIENGEVDYIAMDIKAPISKYPKIANIKTPVSKLKITKSIDLIMNSGIDYEFRTTVAKPLLSVDDVIEIGKVIKGAKRYFIQNYQKSKQINEEMKLSAFSENEIEKLVSDLTAYAKKVDNR